jgi:hypothetical protein
MCGDCHERDRVARVTQTRSDGRKRRWLSELEEYICDLRYLAWQWGQLRVVSEHLEGIDIRGEVCQSQYSTK